MSFDEDIQLKDLVAQTLETNGSLAKIRVNYLFSNNFKSVCCNSIFRLNYGRVYFVH